MKILHIINSLGCGGAESLLSDLSYIQNVQGLDITIAVLRDTDSIFKEKVVQTGIKYIALSKHGCIYNPLLIFKITKLIKDYDLIHVHLFPAQYWVALAKFFTNAKTPIVTTEHSTNNRRREHRVFKYIDAFVYKLYDKIICCSDKAYATFVQHFTGIKSAISIPNGINLERFKSAKAQSKRQLFDLPENTFIITMVARFQPPKRQDTLVKALKYLPDNCCVVFAGNKQDDPNVEVVENLIKKLKLENRVRLLGVRSDVPEVLKTSDIIVLASDYEGLSLSSIEGMAVKKPFIATDVNGLSDVVSGAGLLYEKDNSQMLADKIVRLMQNDMYYNEISESCFMRASQYDIDNMAQSYLKVYKELLP